MIDADLPWNRLGEAESPEDWSKPVQATLGFLDRHGMPARLVRLDRLGDLEREFAERRATGLLDPELQRNYLDDFVFSVPEDLPEARSILVAAVPRPETAAIFTRGGRARRLVIPPTYTAYRATMERWLAWLGEELARHGHHVAPTSLPLKLLAARSGLARYGRNNITYVAGLGSYLELVAAYTSLPCEADAWGGAERLERCSSCGVCARQCPTGAIRSDRFLLDTARCLTFHNERSSDRAFPDWIGASVHHSVVGCMRCQWSCPENRRVSGWTGTSHEFTEEETELLVAGPSRDELSTETLAKLESLDALRFLPLLARNLPAALSSDVDARAGAPRD